MAQIIGSYFTSHVPSIGAAIARDLQQDAYWSPFFDGLIPVRRWLSEQQPDVAVVFKTPKSAPVPEVGNELVLLEAKWRRIGR